MQGVATNENWLECNERGGNVIHQDHDLPHAFLLAIVSTSGRIHGELHRLPLDDDVYYYIRWRLKPCLLAARKPTCFFQALGEGVDVDSDAYITAGVGVRVSGACGLPLVWRARKTKPSRVGDGVETAPPSCLPTEPET